MPATGVWISSFVFCGIYSAAVTYDNMCDINDTYRTLCVCCFFVIGSIVDGHTSVVTCACQCG